MLLVVCVRSHFFRRKKQQQQQKAAREERMFFIRPHPLAFLNSPSAFCLRVCVENQFANWTSYVLLSYQSCKHECRLFKKNQKKIILRRIILCVPRPSSFLFSMITKYQMPETLDLEN